MLAQSNVLALFAEGIGIRFKFVIHGYKLINWHELKQVVQHAKTGKLSPSRGPRFTSTLSILASSCILFSIELWVRRASESHSVWSPKRKCRCSKDRNPFLQLYCNVVLEMESSNKIILIN